MPILIIN